MLYTMLLLGLCFSMASDRNGDSKSRSHERGPAGTSPTGLVTKSCVDPAKRNWSFHSPQYCLVVEFAA